MAFMSQRSVNVIVQIVKYGLFLLPVTVLIVSGEFIGNIKGDLGNFIAAILMPGVGDMFFPFITGKNFFFRIVIEVLFALWIFAAVFDKKYRPNFSPIFWALLATIIVLTLATIFGVNPYRSFWSNYERMEGLFGHLHLFLYFLIAISVLKTERDWKWLFHASIFVSILVGLYSVWQLMGRLEIHQGGDRIDATLGNATYLAVYMLFHVFLVLYYFLVAKSSGWKLFYASLFVFYVFLLYQTATRGAILGFLGGVLLFGILVAVLSKEKIYRVFAFFAVGVVVFAVFGFYLLRNTTFVSQSQTLSRFRNISFEETTTQSRFILAKMSWRAFLERPILGWGPENFNVVFSKYYDPRLWRQEPWFDRAHNVVLDWLTSGGILGLTAYLGIFGSAIFLLWKSYFRGFCNVAETAVFTALLAGYFFQNIFVFDQTVSYFLFFSVLAFLHFKTSMSSVVMAPTASAVAFQANKNSSNFVLPIFAALLVIFSLYFLNFKPLLASRTLLDALKVASADVKKVDETLAKFDSVFSLNTFGVSEAREQLANYANSVISSDVSQELKLKAYQKTVSEMEKQLAENPLDPRGHLFLSSVYQRAGQMDSAIGVLSKAVTLSPTRPHILFVLADAYLNKGDNPKALELVEKAYNLDTSYQDAVRNLAVVAVINGKYDLADKTLKQFFGTTVVADQQLLNAYARMGAYDKVRDIWLKFVESEPNNAQHRVSLAATYVKLGDRMNAILELQKAAVVNPAFKSQAEQIINEIQARRTP